MGKTLLVAVAGLGLAYAGSAHAAVLTSATTDLPADVFTPPTTSTGTYVGVTGSVTNVYASPFGDTTSPYVAVEGGGSAFYNIAGSALSFVFGTPDSYNTISFLNASGVFDTFTTAGTNLSNLNNYFVTITPTGAFTGVEFSSSVNALEFSNVSAVPLPAAAPMFGAALLVLAGLGYGAKRKMAVAV